MIAVRKEKLNTQEKELKKQDTKIKKIIKTNLAKKRKENVQNLTKYSKIGLIAKYNKDTNLLENQLAKSRDAFVILSQLIGILVHPQINYEMAGLFLDGTNLNSTRTDTISTVICQCGAYNQMRTGDKNYYLTMDLLCEECKEPNKGKMYNSEELAAYEKDLIKNLKET